jgi:uncharacterized Zn finger protein
VFDLEQLKQRAGLERFLQGQKLAEQGQVSRVAISANQVTGIVSGQDDYHVCLSQGTDNHEDEYDIINGCSCPAAEYQDVCKHCVALAIVASQCHESLPDLDEQTQVLRQHLSTLPNEQLLDMMMDSIVSQPREWDKWQLILALKPQVKQGQYQAARQSTDSLELLTSLLINALPQESCWEWREVREYFNNAENQFDLLIEASEALSIDQQWDFCMAAIERLNLVLEQMDDSGGHRFGIEGQLNEKLGSLFAHLSWSDDIKAQWLIDHLDQTRFDVFPCVPNDFSLTQAVRTVFLTKCSQRTQHMIEQSKPKRIDELSKFIYPLIEQAKKIEDWQEQCRLYALIAKNHRDYLNISQIYLDNNEALEAERCLLQAKQCSSGGHELWVCAQHEVKVCVALGEHSLAWKKAWQLFCQRPSFTEYCQLERLHLTLGEPEPDFLTAVERVLTEQGEITSKLTWEVHDDILTFYLHHQQVDKARMWANNHQASEKNLQTLAKLTLRTHPQESMVLLHRVLKATIEQTNNSAYDQALALLLEISILINGDEKHAAAEPEFTQLLLALAQQFKAKRNMLKLLRQHFSHCIH